MMEEPPINEILRLPAMVGRGAAKKLYHNEKGERVG
jgi:hypothetical protein